MLRIYQRPHNRTSDQTRVRLSRKVLRLHVRMSIDCTSLILGWLQLAGQKPQVTVLRQVDGAARYIVLDFVHVNEGAAKALAVWLRQAIYVTGVRIEWRFPESTPR